MKTKIKVKGFYTDVNELNFDYDNEHLISVINEKIKDLGVHFDKDFFLCSKEGRAIRFKSNKTLEGYFFLKTDYHYGDCVYYIFLNEREFLKEYIKTPELAWKELKSQISDFLEAINFEQYDKEFILK